MAFSHYGAIANSHGVVVCDRNGLKTNPIFVDYPYPLNANAPASIDKHIETGANGSFGLSYKPVT
ncbi:hypothetical protein D0962_19290 [Leptolyngbyaceae cyanobacterium CCMR0082]|uniref:Uncharacterized protein n=1 Tax=Adonisia turfae CCMR0082 TaxID=2304604 RepID=A0A6M0S8U7_9CYAN|nr:hypothetical protein [Adonisia turfae]NEZ64904.1 hypothetical protein [Adonisia turfae CCMR0082]